MENEGSRRSSVMATLCVIAFLSMLAGAIGMAVSFLFMSRASMQDVTSGAAGFVAGSVLIGAGLFSLSLLAARKD